MSYAGRMETTSIMGVNRTSEETTLRLSDVITAWEMYEATFKPLAALAAQRHVMTETEFVEVVTNPLITKYLTWLDGDLIGIGVQTTALEEWPLISPDFFEARWPDLYEQRHIWYVGFVCTRQEPKAPAGTFSEIITRMSEPTRAVAGVSVMDFCTYNVAVRRMPPITERILRGTDPEVYREHVDSQEFWAYKFSGKRA